MLRVALTHDVDRIYKSYQYATRFVRKLGNLQIGSAFSEFRGLRQYGKLYWNFEDIMSLEESYGLRSTFFFLVETMPFKLIQPSQWKLSLGRYRIDSPKLVEVIHALDQGGWEIGLHGSYLSYKSLQLLIGEKRKLETVLGHAIHGVRQHYLNLNGNTWALQKKAGFAYDSSWGLTDAIGFKGGRYTPFHPLQDEFTAFPMVIMDSCYMEDKKKDKHLEELIDISCDHNGILVVCWHSNNFHPVEYPGYRKAYCAIIEKCQALGAIFKTLDEFSQIRTT